MHRKKGDFDMYTVRFQLELSGSEKRFLSKSFFYANQMHNQLVRYATNRLNALFHDKEYVGARKAYGEAEYSKKKVSELSASEKKKKKEEKEKIDPKLEAVYHDLEEQMKGILGTKVCINHKDAKKGKLEIEYYSQDELDRIIDMIRTIQK